MDILDFISVEEIDDLPEDDEGAFLQFVQLAQKRLGERLRALDDEEESWRETMDARYGFQNVVVGAAKRYGIKPFSEAIVPLQDGYAEKDFRQFKSDLDHYMVQIMLAGSSKRRQESVLLSDDGRSKIRTQIFHMREAIDASSLPASKKEFLHKKLAELELELNRKRVRTYVVFSVIMTLMAAPGSVEASWDTITRLAGPIWATLAHAKAVEDETPRLPYKPEPLALIPPRPEVKRRPDLDDEIPF